MNEMEKQFAEMEARTKRVYNSVINTVNGGFVITGTTSWQNPLTGGFEHTKNDQCVAVSPEDAHQKSLNYFRSGNFEGVLPAAAVTAAQPVAEAPATI